MANVLCVWEMGGALGHLANLRPFIEGALAAGHNVSLAVKELHNVDALLEGYDIRLFQAPYLHRPITRRYEKLSSFSQLVLQRFTNAQELSLLVRAWDAIFEAVKPDIVIYDFTYSALVASYDRPWRKWLVGNGFTIPHTEGPYVGLFPNVANTEENHKNLREAEKCLVDITNSVLSQRGSGTVASPAAIITQAEHQLLLSLPALDLFGARLSGQYLGLPAPRSGTAPQWPDEGKIKVFGYLSAFGLLEELLEALLKYDTSLLIYCRDVTEALRQKYSRIAFVDRPVDLNQVCSQADLVVNMGGHGTIGIGYLWGIPQLMIPRKQEQWYMSRRIAQQKRGMVLLQDDRKNYDAIIANAVAMAGKGRFPVEEKERKELNGERLARFITEQFAG